MCFASRHLSSFGKKNSPDALFWYSYLFIVGVWIYSHQCKRWTNRWDMIFYDSCQLTAVAWIGNLLFALSAGIGKLDHESLDQNTRTRISSSLFLLRFGIWGSFAGCPSVDFVSRSVSMDDTTTIPLTWSDGAGTKIFIESI